MNRRGFFASITGGCFVWFIGMSEQNKLKRFIENLRRQLVRVGWTRGLDMGIICGHDVVSSRKT
jgi:hypothetical protein